MKSVKPANPPESLQRLQKQFAAHIRNPFDEPVPDGIEDRRMAIYRDLFYNNIRGFLSKNFPVLAKIYGDRDWRRMVRDFYINHRARTPLFPQLPREFLRYLQEVRKPQPEDPPFLLELAHYEWVELAVSIDEGHIDADDIDPQGDLLTGIPVLSPVAWPLSYSFPVHRIRPDFQPDKPAGPPTNLMVYRNRSDKVQFMELNPVTAHLVQVLKANTTDTGLDCLNRLVTDLNHPKPEVVLDGGKQQLEAFRSRDIIAGVRKSPVAH